MVKYSVPLLLIIAILAIFSIYYPGLSGPFMLDDLASLPSLFKAIDFYNFWYAVFDGVTGPTGRPVALFTFALQQSQWDNPFGFKLINLLIHLANCGLIFLLTLIIVRSCLKLTPRQTFLIALGTALIWGILPIHVSTVLYVVQRMVLLSTFFTLLGLLGYLWGRNHLVQGNTNKGLFVLCFTVSLSALFAIFSKESGFLLIFYILVTETTINRFVPLNSKPFDVWKSIFLFLPLILALVYIVYKVDDLILQTYTTRTFSLIERLMTEPRVLWSYVAEIYFPRASNLTLFHENYVISKNLFNPLSTIISIIGWIIMLIISYIYRIKSPLVTFSILWFLLGHSMESTVFGLEIYFEHRNYLPSYSLVLGMIILFATYIINTSDSRKLMMYKIVGLVYVGLLTSVSIGQARLWGNEREFAFVQAEEHPYSIRARWLKAQYLVEQGLLDKAYEEAEAIQIDFPELPSTLLIDLDFACLDKKFTVTPISEIQNRLQKAKFSIPVIKTIENYIEYRANNRCQNVDYNYVVAVTDALLANPQYDRHKEILIYSASLLQLGLGDIAKATSFLESLPDKGIDTNIQLARLYASQGRNREALEVLDSAEKKLKVGFKYSMYMDTLSELRNAILQNSKKQFPAS